jgi:hypothetical protein
MVSKTAFGLFLVASAFVSPALGDADHTAGSDAPKRQKVPCPKLRQRVEKTAKSMGLDEKITPNSWGNIPGELRKLPAGSENCGVDAELAQVLISSPLYGKDLEIFYGPLFAKIGCRPLTCTSGAALGLVEQTRCRCAMPGVVGTIITDTRTEAFTLAIAK